MTTTNANKSSDKSAGTKSKAPNRASSTKRSAKASGNFTRRQASNKRRRRDELPDWAAGVASLIGVGVAIGFGLLATRNRWMPYAEKVNGRLHDRWDSYLQSRDSEYDEYDDPDMAKAANNGLSHGPKTASVASSPDHPPSNA
ncbi:MAG: hypothetical protein ACRCY3_00425 [Sphingorhabdus sp.]